MRRAIAGWGMGHVALGDARGWLLLCLEVAWIATLVIGLSLMPTDHWLVVVVLLAGVLGVWVGQAVLAHRNAARLSGSDRGALQLAAVMPLGLVVLTAFWSAGGVTASPEATLQHFVSAWETGHAERALDLFADPTGISAVDAAWADDTSFITARAAGVAGSHPEWGLDTLQPYRNLRFEPVAAGGTAPPDAGHAAFAVQLVRQIQVPTSFLGLFAATRSETQPVERVGEVTLLRRTVSVALPLPGGAASVWLIETVDIRGAGIDPSPDRAGLLTTSLSRF